MLARLAEGSEVLGPQMEDVNPRCAQLRTRPVQDQLYSIAHWMLEREHPLALAKLLECHEAHHAL